MKINSLYEVGDRVTVLKKKEFVRIVNISFDHVGNLAENWFNIKKAHRFLLW